MSSDKDPAAAAKSLQSCRTLRDPIDGSPPGSPVPGILQARTLEWVAISFTPQNKNFKKKQSKTKPGIGLKELLTAHSTYHKCLQSNICCCYCSVTKSCLTLCDPTDYSSPGSSVLHYLPEFAQILVISIIILFFSFSCQLK